MNQKSSSVWIFARFANLLALTKRIKRLPTPVRLATGLAMLIIIGTGLLMLPVASLRGLHLNEALFTAVSALSVTGLSVISPSRDLTPFGQFVLMVLIQTGGVGFMILASVIFALIGRRISLTNRLAITDSLGLVRPGAVLTLTRNVIIGVHVVELIGAAFLWVRWRGELGDGKAAFYALFHAVSAFCNAGFDLFDGRIPNDGLSLLIIGSLITLGGLGIPVLGDLFVVARAQLRHRLHQPHSRRERSLSLHSRLTLIAYAALVLIGWLALFVAERQPTHTLYAEPLDRQLSISLFQSVATRTAGFVAVPSYSFEALAPASQLVMIVLMFIGCAPASMGGGITTGTLIVLILALWSYARQWPVLRVSNRSLSPGTVRRAAAVLITSLMVVITATWLILVTHEVTLDAALFEVVSAFATCGLTLALTGSLNLFGQIVIMLVMFWGRLGALTLVSAVAWQPTRRDDLVSYPEEPVLIG